MLKGIESALCKKSAEKLSMVLNDVMDNKGWGTLVCR